MTVEEKLTLIAQNEQKVYNAGYKKGKSEGGGETIVLDNCKNYVDLSEYVDDFGVVDHVSFNAKLAELSLQSKGGPDRVEIYFYQSGEETFVFDNLVIWQSNCDYYYMALKDYTGISAGISLRGIDNCRFYGFSIYLIASNPVYALSVDSCSNIEFYDCHFENQFQVSVNITNCHSIYFNDCNIYGGTFPGQQPCVTVSDNSTSAGTIKTPVWIIFENCYFLQGDKDTSAPLIDCTGVSNANCLVSVLHCVTNGMDDVTEERVAKGSGKVRIPIMSLPIYNGEVETV